MARLSKWQRHQKKYGGKGLTAAKIKSLYKSNAPAWYGQKRAHSRAAKQGWGRKPYARNPGGLQSIMPSKLSQATHGATFMEIAVAGIGIVAALTIPKLLKWNTGWKYAIAGIGTAIVGGFLVGKWNKTAGKIFFVTALGTTLVIGLRSLLAKHKTTGLFGQDEFDEEELFGQEDELFGEDEELFGADEEIYGVDVGGDDIIRPTASIEEFVE